MGSVDYDHWATYTMAALDAYGWSATGRVADLGCGTGAIARRLNATGLAVLGLDLSRAMVAEARRRGGRIPYGVADVRSLPLRDRSCAAALCLFDTVNYLLTLETLESACREAARILEPGAPFAFDINTPHAFAEYWCGEEQLIVCDPDLVAIWDGSMEEEQIARLDLTLFQPAEGDLYSREVEVHRERAHTLPEVRAALAQAGFGDVQVYEHLSFAAPTEVSERLLVIARAPGAVAGVSPVTGAEVSPASPSASGA